MKKKIKRAFDYIACWIAEKIWQAIEKLL